MFGTIRKHQTWLWVVLIGLMIFGLVSWQNQLGKSGSGQRVTGDFGTIDNRPITATEMQNAQNEARLMYFLQRREWPTTDQPVESYQRVFLIRKLEEYNIHADANIVAQTASEFLRQFGNGQTIPLDVFVERVLAPHGLFADDFQRFIEHDLSIRQLVATVGAGGGLVPPAEIQSLYVQSHQELKVKLVSFSASNYLASVPEPAPALLGQFYTNMEAEYREPDQMQLSYVLINVTNFLAEAEQKLGTNLSSYVEEEYRRAGTNWVMLGKTPEEAKTKLHELIIRQVALTNALEKAKGFQADLVAREPARPENLNVVAKEKGLEVKVSKPFDKEYGPSDIHLPSSYPSASLFNLNPDDPFPDRPVQGMDGAYILAFNKFIPSRVPPMEEIHSRVVADCKYAQAMRIAQETGRAFAHTATNELAKGQAFDAICAAARVKSLDVPPFSESTETLPQVEDYTDLPTLKSVTFETPVGRVSDFAQTREGGIVVCVRERLPIDEARMKAELPEFSNAVRQQRENEAFDLWFRKEASAALRNIPALQRQPGRS